jgi:hypothetical protein
MLNEMSWSDDNFNLSTKQKFGLIGTNCEFAHGTHMGFMNNKGKRDNQKRNVLNTNVKIVEQNVRKSNKVLYILWILF